MFIIAGIVVLAIVGGSAVSFSRPAVAPTQLTQQSPCDISNEPSRHSVWKVHAAATECRKSRERREARNN